MGIDHEVALAVFVPDTLSGRRSILGKQRTKRKEDVLGCHYRCVSTRHTRRKFSAHRHDKSLDILAVFSGIICDSNDL